MIFRKRFLILIFIINFPLNILAEKPVQSLRFVSLKSNNITMRVGPGYNYPILWEYHRANLPLEVIAEFDDWRKVRDKSRDMGWIHKSMLSGKRYGLIILENTSVYKNESQEGPIQCKMGKNTLVQLLKCQNTVCQITARLDKKVFKGWILRKNIWGLYPHETIFK